MEALSLAPYAVFSGKSRGRRHSEEDHPLRTVFQRDRDRIIHSRAFRRLEYKTQVFITGQNDHFRTRLTHTIEVAGITRTVARSLRLNEDLAETIALAHDLGHPPFGHCGETTLNELLADEGGFDHNRQSLRIVDELEEKYPGFTGLNLSWELRTGLIKHRHDDEMTLDGIQLHVHPHLESQSADLSDNITYLGHDLDDGFRSGLLKMDDVQSLRIWKHVESLHEDKLSGEPIPESTYVSFMIRNIIDFLVADLVSSSYERLETADLHTYEDAEKHTHRLIIHSDDVASMSLELKNFLFDKMYWHTDVHQDNERADALMRDLYSYFMKKSDQLDEKVQGRIKQYGLARAVADHIAGMTDRYAIQIHRECYD
ncbi:deoxyguanosinetriphosphate triphosphohydrolase [bacterium AH-315-E10]|nr:deoxyguanosinetriphosphate triphosphohydrolase [bacterium AH-315-E10]